MARRPRLGEDQLFEVATYLANPNAHTEIHAELPAGHQARFEAEYAAATNGYPLPARSDQEPYYIWPRGTDKRGRELRIYFVRVAPEPPPIQRLYTDYAKWYAKGNCYRINHSNLVMQLFECGFVLGKNTNNANRIAEFMQRRFPVRC